MTMMGDKTIWTRRSFVSTLGLAGMATAVPHLRAMSAPSVTTQPERGLAFIAVSGPTQPGGDRVDVFHLDGSRGGMSPVSSTPLASPSALVLHPVLPILYVAHATDLHENLPRGSVSAHAFDGNGGMSKICQEPLALSATNPGHLAISPDGRRLIVSSASGGTYNVFNLDIFGGIQPGVFPLKQTGSGPHPGQTSARPHSAVFSADGSTAYATDRGADRLNHIGFVDSVPFVLSRLSLAPGSGPSHLALHPSGGFLIVASSLKSTLSVVPIDQKSGQVLTPSHHRAVNASAIGPIAFSPSGKELYVAATREDEPLARVTSYRLSPGTGRLRQTLRKDQTAVGSPSHFYSAGGRVKLLGSSGIHAMGDEGFVSVAHQPACERLVSLAIRVL